MNFRNTDDINVVIRKIPERYRSKHIFIISSTAFSWVGWKRSWEGHRVLGYYQSTSLLSSLLSS